MKKTKILAILQLPPPIHGASVVNQNIKDSKKINDAFDIDYIPLHFAKEINQIGKIQISKFFKMFKYGFQIFFKLMFNKYDLIYFTLSPIGGTFYRDVVFVSIMKLFKAKRVYHLHGKGIKKASDRNSINKLLYGWVFTNAKVIHLSKLLYFDIEQYVNKDDCFFVANGIKKESQNNDNIYDETKRPVKLLYLSNMVKTKGVVDFINALNLLNLKGRLSFDVHFAGAWSRDINESIFNKLISNFNLTKNIKYHGPLYNKEKEKVFQSADIFILPTKNECFPLVLLEAMSYGLPIITTFEGAIPEIIEDGVNGLLVEQGNVEQLAEKIEFVSNNTNLRVKMMNSNFSKFNNEYKFTNFEENFWNVINSIYSGDLT